MKKLSDILIGVQIEEVIGSLERELSEIQFDSRKVKINDLFIAAPGTLVDGHNYIEKAISSGAVAILCKKLPEIQNNITYIRVKNAAETLAHLSANYYDHPSKKLKLVGVTGTNGKTTIATLLHRLFRLLGYRVGLLSTIENFIDDQLVVATHTTPDVIQVNALLNEMVQYGCDYCFMEVSSHSVVQHRISGLYFSGGIFTNLTHDHLDYHGTFNEYLTAKKGFFDKLPSDAFALTNVDDKTGKVMVQNTSANKVSYALKSFADYKGKIFESHFDGMLMSMDGTEMWTRFIGNFNAYNLLAVYACALLLDQKKEEVLSALSSLDAVNGRFEYLKSPIGTTAIVDYAHTPDALKNVLSTIGGIRTNNELLITVFGAGGDRDRTKRPEMMKAVCAESDKVIVTSDNPRSEDPEAIIDDIMAGAEIENRKKILRISDRKEAIRTACMLAGPKDIILVAGKGHETYQEIKGIRTHFDDKEVIKTFFEQQ